jgi:hypothetical protein
MFMLMLMLLLFRTLIFYDCKYLQEQVDRIAQKLDGPAAEVEPDKVKVNLVDYGRVVVVLKKEEGHDEDES